MENLTYFNSQRLAALAVEPPPPPPPPPSLKAWEAGKESELSLQSGSLFMWGWVLTKNDIIFSAPASPIGLIHQRIVLPQVSLLNGRSQHKWQNVMFNQLILANVGYQAKFTNWNTRIFLMKKKIASSSVLA